MQAHVNRKHNLGYGEYCFTHGDPMVSKVMHLCGIGSGQFSLNDKDAYLHLWRHGLGYIDYYATYIMDANDANVNGK